MHPVNCTCPGRSSQLHCAKIQTILSPVPPFNCFQSLRNQTRSKSQKSKKKMQKKRIQESKLTDIQRANQHLGQGEEIPHLFRNMASSRHIRLDSWWPRQCIPGATSSAPPVQVLVVEGELVLGATQFSHCSCIVKDGWSWRRWQRRWTGVVSQQAA